MRSPSYPLESFQWLRAWHQRNGAYSLGDHSLGEHLGGAVWSDEQRPLEGVAVGSRARGTLRLLRREWVPRPVAQKGEGETGMEPQ